MNNLFPFILQIGLGEDNKDQIPNTNVTIIRYLPVASKNVKRQSIGVI